MYDIIFIGNNESSFLKLRERFPTAKRVCITTNILDAFNEAKRKAFTKMFWVVWDDLIIAEDFNFNYKVEPWDEKYIHLFLNGSSYDGVCLFSKKAIVSNRELTCRFFINKKETGICASTPIMYDKFEIVTYEDYLKAVDVSKTEMLWLIFNDINVVDDFKFDLYFSHHNQYDRKINHMFLNGNFYDGVILASKNKLISKREFDYRFIVDKKEWDIVASTPKPFDIFYINSYDEYLEACTRSTSDMFWVVWNNLTVNSNFKFDYYVPVYDTFHRNITHVFKNGKYYDGVCLFSKKTPVSKKEFEYRFFTNKKEVDISVSRPNAYQVFNITTYNEYLAACSNSTTDMFWVVWNDIILNPKFKFDYYIPMYDTFHRNITHVFKNGEYFDGVCLFSKKTPVSKKEFEYRFFTNKKEVDIAASTPKPFDVVFISYFEKVADENYQKLLNHLQPNQNAYRVNGIKGIHQAHQCAASLVTSDMFWVVDADAVLESNFKFEFPQVVKHDTYTKSIVHVWRSRNPINDLEYGYGGVKLLPTQLTLGMDIAMPDMTTSISASFKSMLEVSNVAGFNTDPFTTWRSAFRECVKLSSKTIQGQVDTETEERLNVWCTIGVDKPFGNYAIAGAIAGRKYGQENAGNIPALSLINDFDWLKSQFEQTRLP